MYTPTQLEAIRIFGRKDLTEGCLIRIQSKYPSWAMMEYWWDEDAWDYDDVIRKINEDEELNYDCYEITINDISANEDDDMIFTILWHEPHLEDVFRVSKEKWVMINLSRDSNNWFELFVWMKHFPYNPTITLIEQSEETLKQLISLFK